MSVSHFMEIHQKEKESLAAYIHCFKREASRCIFNNDTATIRIFIKGFRNAHTLATRVYEKGPQSLADGMKEVEKLQTAQQLKATLLPSSSVNSMSSDDDKCFQCQESGHMARHCPCIRCFDCDEYGHVAADCPDKIPPSGTPARHRNNNSNMRQHDRSTSHNNHCNRHPHHDHQDRHRLRSHSCNHRYRSNSCSDSWRSHSRSHHWLTCCSTSCHRNSSAYYYWWDTPHRRPSSHRNSSRDCSRSRSCTSYKHNHKASSKLSYSSDQIAWKNKDKKYKQVAIDDPPSKYYSSDDQCSKSNEGFKLGEPSPNMLPHKWGGLPKRKTITIAHITDCPTITVHAGKCYKALIDSGATISLLRYSTYNKIEDCYMTPIQPTTAKLNSADGSPMSAIGTTALHLRIAEFKFTHNFIICDQLPETELILVWYAEKILTIICMGQGRKLLHTKGRKILCLHKQLWSKGNNRHS